jgi:hypothetical protein
VEVQNSLKQLYFILIILMSYDSSIISIKAAVNVDEGRGYFNETCMFSIVILFKQELYLKYGVYNTSCYKKFWKCAPACCIYNRAWSGFIDTAYSIMGEMSVMVLDMLVFSSFRLRGLLQ